MQMLTSREEGKPLITVANHRSILDDPVMMASIVPWWCLFHPKYIRWNICTQERCFEVNINT